jgi:lactoylglutathione lyase
MIVLGASDSISLDGCDDRDIPYLRHGVRPTRGGRVKTLFVSYRITDLDRSLAFYSALGYVELGRVDLGDSSQLVILKFPDEAAASLELVHRAGGGSVDVGSGFDHLAIEVESLTAALARLTAAGLEPGPVECPGGPHGPKTSWLTDPDGYRIELVEWPPESPGGITGEFS